MITGRLSLEKEWLRVNPKRGGPLGHGGKVGEAVGEEVGVRDGWNDDAVDERDDRNNDFFWNLENGEKTERKRI